MMNMDVIKSFTEQMQGFAAPLTRYNWQYAVLPNQQRTWF
jgi:hypothetical protein